MATVYCYRYMLARAPRVFYGNGKWYLEVLTRIIACVYGVLVRARVRVELAAVDFDGRKG
jgi:hypothetical protein